MLFNSFRGGAGMGLRNAVRLAPRGFLGTIVLALAAEHFLAAHSLLFTRPECWDWRLSVGAVVKQAPKCQVLCFGTSRAQQAIVPQVVEERSGLKTWNLANCWGQAPSYYYLLKYALDAGARPRAVVVEYHPQCLGGDIWQVVRNWPEQLGPREALDVAWTTRDADFFASTALAHFSPSIKDRFQIRANLLAALRGEASELVWTNLTYMRNKKSNRGALVGGRNTSYKGAITGPIAAGLLPETWSCHPQNAIYVRRFLDLAAAKGIRVYWLMPPFCPALQQGRERKGLDAGYAQFARDFVARYPNLVVLDAQHSGYDATVFLDPAHLDRQGACTLSADLGDFLRADRTGTAPASRWIDLPAYRDRAPGVPVEDLGESHVALMANKARRRGL